MKLLAHSYICWFSALYTCIHAHMFDLLDVRTDEKPSDAALNGILRISPDWTSWILELGVPIEEVRVFRSDREMGGIFALQYWRDGKSGELYPSTWKFLLDTVEKAKGPEVAQKILEAIRQNETSWCAS